MTKIRKIGLFMLIGMTLAFAIAFSIIYIFNPSIRRVWLGDYKCDIFPKFGRVFIAEYKGNEEDLRIPDKIGPFKVVDIVYDAYMENEYVKRLYISNKQYDGSIYFKGCKNLEEVICEDGLVELNYYFSYSKKLRGVKLPDSVEIIEDGAFEGCSSLEDITIPNNGKLIYIGVNAFKKTAFEQKHKKDRYYAVGNTLIFDNAQTDEEIVIPQGIKRDCGRITYTIEKADVYCPDSLLAADYTIETEATLYFGPGELEEINIEGEGTVVAPENSPIAKYCQENGINFRPITDEEDAIRREKTEAAAADVVYQDE